MGVVGVPAEAWTNAQHNVANPAPLEAPSAWPEEPDAMLDRVDLHGGMVDEEEATRLAIEVRPYSFARCKFCAC